MEPGSAPPASTEKRRARPRRQLLRIAETLAFGVAGGAAFNIVRFPAGWLAGAMVFCAAAALYGRPIGLPRPIAQVFYVLVGLALGSTVSPESLRGIATWPLSITIVVVAMVCVTLATATYLRRVHGWDAMTALLAGYPGAFGQVMAHAVDEHCDLRAIAVVQMIRVIMLTVGLPAALAAFGLTASVGPLARPSGSLAAAPGEFVVLVVASVATGAGLLRLGLPGGLLLGSMTASAILHGSGFISVTLPNWLTVAGVIGIGSIGGARFAGTSVRLVLAFCGPALGCFAISLGIATAFGGIADLLVAAPPADIAVGYLPGAIDAMMVLALALHLDPIFVGAHHLARLFGLSFALPFAIRSVRKNAARRDGAA